MGMQTPAVTTVDPADVLIAQAEVRQRCRRRWLIVGGVVGLLASYPLSLGPLVFLDQNGLIPDSLILILGVIYFPFEHPLNSVPVIEYFFKSYFSLLGIET